MTTNIEKDDHLMKEALKWSGLKSKKEIVHAALIEFIKFQKKQAMKNLQGKVEWIGDINKMRTLDKLNNHS